MATSANLAQPAPVESTEAAARAQIARAAAPVDAAMAFEWTAWQDVRQRVGVAMSGPWPELCCWLAASADFVVTESCPRVDCPAGGCKHKAAAWAPTVFRDNDRCNDNALKVSALVLDCDDGGDWVGLLDALDSAMICYFAHRSASYVAGQSCNWRVAVPLAEPFSVVERGTSAWATAYNAGLRVLGAVGGVRFDTSCTDAARLWFTPAALQRTPKRQLRFSLAARALDLQVLASEAVSPRPAPVGHSPLPTTVHPNEGAIRARAWLAKREPAVQGAGGDKHTFNTLAQLIRKFGLTADDAAAIAAENWNCQCQPPWAPSDLMRKARAIVAYKTR